MPAARKQTSSSPERKGAHPKKNAMLTAEQLEHMTTHELANMLANVVLLLRRMPDVPCQELAAREPDVTAPPEAISTLSAMRDALVEPASGNKEGSTQHGQRAVSTIQQHTDELMDKQYTVAKLKTMADDLGIPYPTKATKAELVKRIAERQARGHSEQYAIMHL